MDFRYRFLTSGIPWTQSMPSHDVKAATRLAEASWRRDNVFKDSSSPFKASSFNPLSPDILTLYRRPNPIKIWLTYAVPPTAQHTTCGERDHPRPFFNRLKNLSRSPRPLRAGPTTPRCILDQHTLSPIKARSLPIRQFFQSGRERGFIGSLVWTGLNIA